MAENRSFSYCDSDEEVFFGKVTEKELLKKALLGYNTDSSSGNSTPRAIFRPDEKSTPITNTLNRSPNLPDVLNGSRSESVGSPTSSRGLENDKQRACPSLNNSFDKDEDVIYLGSVNNSIQVFTDDESFLLNEKIIYDNGNDIDLGTKNVGLIKELETLCVLPTIENSATKVEVNTNSVSKTSAEVKDSDVHIEEDCVNSNKGFENLNITKENELDKDLPKQETNTNSIYITKDQNGIVFGKEDVCCLNKGLENLSVSYTKDELDNTVTEQESHEAGLNNTCTMFTDNIQNKTSGDIIECIVNDNISLAESAKQKSPFQKSINDNIYSVNEHSSGSFLGVGEDSKLTELNISAAISQDVTADSSCKHDVSKAQTLQKICPNKKVYSMGLNDTDYISINGISDSVLNISQDSSTFSPTLPGDNKTSGNNLLANVIYEDISFEGEQTLEPVNQNPCISTKSYVQIDELHMSVDEPDYQENLTISDSLETGNSYLSLTTSCFDKSSVSSYHTANADIENTISKPSSDSFNKYRETLNDTVGLEGIDVGTSVDIDHEGKNETSFEMIVQNRQNSFISSPSNVKMVNEPEQKKPKLVSKLPLFHHNSKSLIQPPKLNVVSASLKSNSYKWAKNLQKATLNKEVSEALKNVSCKVPTPNKAVLSQKCQQKNAVLSSTKIGLAYSNIPSANKTPARTISHQTPKVMNSESKSSSVNSPRFTKTLSTEKKLKSKLIPPSSLDKNRFKNIVSPVQAYISGSPTILQERKGVSEEVKIVGVSGNKTTNSHLPQKIKTDGKNIVKKLQYDKIQGQENQNPNYYSRDTLPPRTLQNSEAVFMKEPEPPKKYLPKMGQKMQKLLDTPRPKLVVHQGRVKNSPKAKGVLLPCSNTKSPEHNLDLPAERVSIRMVKTVENTNELK